MIKKGYADKNIDYSERHLAYFTHTPNSFTGDGITNYNSEYGYYGGDHPVYAGQHLAGWQGAELEQNYPFGLKDEMADPDESSRYSSYSHLQDYNIIDVSKVKREIMEYGSVTAGYYDNRQYLSSDYAYYQNIYTNKYGNHSITIVGWDDNYPLENFDGLADKPSAPGAWKVKNSWGNTWGDNGYFWISYEEKSLGDFVSFNAEPADNYQIIHQYDGAQWSSLLTLEKSANIFTADENEVLKAVGFYTSHNSSSYLVDPINYSINIYKLYDNLHGPENGVIVSSVSGVIENDGYHTI